VVTPLDVPGGGPRQALKLAHELKALGHEPVVITQALDRKRCYPELLEGLEIRVSRAGKPLLAASLFGDALNLDTYRRAPIIAAEREVTREFDLVNAHDYSANWPAARAAARLGLPSVWMCNEPPFWLHQMQMRRPWQARLARAHLTALDPEWSFLKVVDRGATRAMDEIVVLDHKNERRIRELYDRPARVVRSGVDAAFFAGGDGEKERRELGLEGAFVLIHIGYAAPWKGQSLSMRALKALLPAVPHARLLLVGHGVTAAYAEEAAALGLSREVTFLEGVSDARLRSLLAASDALLFPADQTWGLNVTEAMAAGRPTIVSAAAGVSEVLEDRKTALIVPHGDPEAIAARAAELALDDGLRRRLGEAGRAFVSVNLTWRRYAEGMVEAYRSAAARATS
jgi:glycosyltransferase involved in cell wall biosynthesis